MTTDTSAQALFPSDVDPKRIHDVADGLRRQGEFEAARMLDSYAAEKHRAREGVTDELVQRACRAYLHPSMRSWPVDFVAMRAALEAVWPDGRDAKDECLKCGAAIDEEYGHVGECIDATKDTDHD